MTKEERERKKRFPHTLHCNGASCKMKERCQTYHNPWFKSSESTISLFVEKDGKFESCINYQPVAFGQEIASKIEREIL